MSRALASFDRLLAELHRMDSVTHQALRPGVTRDRWETLRKRIGVAFPEDLRAVWERHDGENERGAVRFLRYWRMLPVFEIEKEWALMQQSSAEFLPGPALSNPRAPYRSTVWDAGWIPIAEDGSGAHLLIDTNPSQYGTYGQLLDLDPGAEPWPLASDLGTWFDALSDEFAAGRWWVQSDHGFDFVRLRSYDDYPEGPDR